MADKDYEVLVIGGGPAGLSAALYLARYNRRVALFDAGGGRSSWFQVNHNYLGFPGGIAARHLRELGRQQLADYPQVTVYDEPINDLKADQECFIASGSGGQWRGPAVILCTGVTDHYPQFDGWEAYVGRSMFWCITCDGYGCQGLRVVVVGNTNNAASEALQLQRFTDQLTVLTNSSENQITPNFVERLKRHNIPLVHDQIEQVIGHEGQFEALVTVGGQRLELDQLFNQQGATPRSELAAQVGAALDVNGYILTDTEQKTTVPGVYAAGDVTRLFAHQVSTAVHEGGQAASAANYYLYPPDLKDD
ncbi:MAG TPA: NAD(P)/FAD-dependent oxidoreductase [Phototrophicaceae bacterium]|nr:NAD(P)/FAD-dependent oxidoreductase [Phototrophicaceae bacterium]